MMKKTRKNVLIIGVIGCLCWGCSQNRISYEHVLDLAEKQNADYDSITNLDSIRMAVAFFDNHGTANEQVRAHYLLGCAYRDMGEAQKALESYQDANDCADTTKVDCYYLGLMKVHSQMAVLFYHQNLPYEMLEELDLVYKYALWANDELSAIIAIEYKAGAYELLNMPDSCIQIRKNAYQLYKQHGYEKEAGLSVGPLIDKLIDKGRLAEAKPYIDIYEEATGFREKGVIEQRRAIYYYIKGKYYLAVERPDSAKYLFQKLLDPSLDNNQLEAGYRGLYLFYKKTGQKDSLAKYADLCYQLNDASYASKATKEMQRMQALYNYNRSQREASIMKERASNWQKWLLFAVLLVTLLVAYIIIKRYREKTRLQEAQMKIIDLMNQIRTLKAAGEKDSDAVRLLNEQVSETMNQDDTSLHQGKQLYDHIVDGGTVSSWKKREFVQFIDYFTAIDYKTVIQLKKTKRKEKLTTHNLFFLLLKEMGYDKKEIARILGIGETSVNTLNTRTKPVE